MTNNNSQKGFALPMIIGIVALVAVIGGVSYFATRQESSVKNDAMVKIEEGVMKKDNGVMMTKDIVISIGALNDSGQTGKATFSDMSGKTKVVVEISGSVVGVPQPSHIHTGTSLTPGAIVYPLSAVVNGKAETILDVSLETLGTKLPLAIMVHKSKDEAKIFVSGGNLSKDGFPAMTKKDEGNAMMKTDATKTDSMMKKEETSMMDKGDTMMKAGSYEAYAPEKVALASATHDVVLFFRASWCPTCRAVDADIKANLSKIPSSLAILDVNYDNSTALKQKYGVTYQHTFVQVDKDGNLIKKWSGSPTLSALVVEVK